MINLASHRFQFGFACAAFTFYFSSLLFSYSACSLSIIIQSCFQGYVSQSNQFLLQTFYIELLHIECVLLYPVSQKSVSTKWRIYKGKINLPQDFCHGQKFATLSHFMTSGYKRQISRRRPSVNQHLYVIIRS